MDMTLTIGTTSRFVCFLCALASITQLTFGCSQDFLDILGPGVRVKRGPHWKWGNQDGNGLGTVTTEISSSDWITVKWDNGHSNSYRVGHQEKCDLALVDVLDTQCNFFPTNITDTGDFLLSYQDFPRPVHAQYRCHKHIQSQEENKVVAVHVLMMDICNTTIYDGSDKSSALMGTGCDMVSGTYVSTGRDVYVDTFKEMGTKYGFMAYITYEEKECAQDIMIKAASGTQGYINSPYSNFLLGSRINCLWKIEADPDQLLELTVTFLDLERKLEIRENNKTTWTLLNSTGSVVHYTSVTSSVNLKYEKDQKYKSKGFQIVYNTKEKPKKASCPKMAKTLEPGDNGILKLPEYDLKSTGSLECRWKLNTKSKLSRIQLTATRVGSADCHNFGGDFMLNGGSFPSDGGCEKSSFSVTAQEIDISYIASSPKNASIILEYKTTRLPFCLQEERTISVDGEKAFLVIPNLSAIDISSPCQWHLVSPENQKVSLEVIAQTESDWEPYKAFRVAGDKGKVMTDMKGSKILSKGNRLSLAFDKSKQPEDFSGEIIAIYTAVSPVSPVPFVTPKGQVKTKTTMGPAIPNIVSSTTSSQPVVECSQSGAPIWCYIVIAILSIGCLALFITSYTLYRRQIYVCDEHGSLLNLRLQDIIAKDDHI